MEDKYKNTITLKYKIQCNQKLRSELNGSKKVSLGKDYFKILGVR